MEKTELLACHTERDVLISRLEYCARGGYVTSEEKNDLLREALAHLRRTPWPDNKKTALLPLEFVFGHGEFGVGSVAEDESAPTREIVLYRPPNPVLPAGTTLGGVGKHVEELENVLVRMHFENAESAHVFEWAVSRVLGSFGETDNKPLTVEELRARKKPVWCDIPDCEWIPEGGYYCLCNGGFIIAPSGQRFSVDECLKNGWVLLDRPPEKGE